MKTFSDTPGVNALARLRDKYWFVPTLSALTGLVAGILMVMLDSYLGTNWMEEFDTLHSSRPNGAREMLSTIAGSTITVAGVVFSITLAAVTYASGQHGPRLLTNFARDRGNQLTLGTFVGTYVYCLIVLRTIRTAGEGSQAPAFVPVLSVYGALVLALASIFVLIYFFHHVTESIHINKVIARIGRQLIETLKCKGRDVSEATDQSHEGFPADLSIHRIIPKRPGYIAAIDLSALSAIAQKQDGWITAHFGAGDFVRCSDFILDILCRGALSSDTTKKLRDAVLIGDQKTDLQDLRFGFDELTEIAIRAVSTGINDPFTAITCIDWLSASLLQYDRSFAVADPLRSAPSPRVNVPVLSFHDLLEISFGRLRQHAVTEKTVEKAAMFALASLADHVRSTARRSFLLAEAKRLRMSRK